MALRSSQYADLPQYHHNLLALVGSNFIVDSP